MEGGLSSVASYKNEKYKKKLPQNQIYMGNSLLGKGKLLEAFLKSSILRTESPLQQRQSQELG